MTRTNNIAIHARFGLVRPHGLVRHLCRRGRVNSDDDFMVAARSLPSDVLIGTLVAPFIGSGTIIGAGPVSAMR